jgi:exonuclease III
MRLITLNIRGVNSEKIHHFIHSLPDADAVELQETHTTTNKLARLWGTPSKWHMNWSHGDEASRGVAILLNEKTFHSQPNEDNTKRDRKGRWILTTLQNIKEETITAASVYAPSEEKERVSFFNSMSLPLPFYSRAFVGGDWNSIVDAVKGSHSACTNGIPLHQHMPSEYSPTHTISTTQPLRTANTRSEPGPQKHPAC